MNFNVSRLIFIAIFLLGMACNASFNPLLSPQDIATEMRQTPQTHCLRFRKFDMIRRCRRYRNSFPLYSTFTWSVDIPHHTRYFNFRYGVRRHR